MSKINKDNSLFKNSPASTANADYLGADIKSNQPQTEVSNLPSIYSETLEDAFARHKGKASDKWSLYIDVYGEIFSRYRRNNIDVLEIGVQNGGSLEIWADFFKNARLILGCDIDPNCADLEFDDKRINIVVGDVNTDSVENEITSISTSFDIIIDDGSHKSSDIIKSFLRYFKFISNDGVYIVEDMHCSYWKEYEGGLNYPKSSMYFFKNLLDAINQYNIGAGITGRDVLETYLRLYDINFSDEDIESIRSIEFFDSLCVVRKSSRHGNNLGARRVVGSEAAVYKNVFYSDQETLVPPDQSNNPWSVLHANIDGKIYNVRELAENQIELHNEIANEKLSHRAAISDLNAARDEARYAQQERERAGEQLAERNALLTSLQGELAKLQVELALSMETAELLRTRQQELDGRIDEYRWQAGQSAEIIQTLRIDIEAANAKQVEAAAERERYKQDAEHNRRMLVRAEVTLADVSRRNAQMLSEVAELHAKVTEGLETIADKEVQIARLVSEIEQRDRRIVELQDEVERLAVRISGLSEDLTAAKRRNAGLQWKIDTRDGQIRELKADIDFIRRQLDVETSSLLGQVHECEGQIAQLVADHRVAWEKVRESHVHSLSLVDRLEAAETRIRQMERSLAWRLFGPWRAFRRWRIVARSLFGQSVALAPAHQLDAVDRTDGLSEWVMTGVDPNFELSWHSGEPLAPGHYAISFEAPETIAALKYPKLYVDTGSGYNEPEALSLQSSGRDKLRFEAKFSLTNGALALRFDPSVQPGRLVIGGAVNLRRLTRLEYYTHLTRRVLEARQRLDGSIWPSVWSGLTTLREQGLLGGIATLRSTAQTITDENGAGDAGHRRFLRTETKYVPISSQPPLAAAPVTLICFYLPQFHPIPQNDAWWGEGFTEWTNVRPAQPQFEGHYQPHVPDLLGYYDLRDTEVQRKQIELAKLYGIGGFCFYFYWFAGERLLENPTLNYLDDASLDFPFCVCWANENWSRRWDGRDDEILIGQDHSPEDDLAFIAYIAKYLRDPRYIRIQDKPLLLVYRPSLLPDPAETAKRWRQWCRNHDIGEIYLAYTQSFEANDPSQYGFDAAIEFPPNNSAPPSIVDTVVPLNPDFGSKVYDWTIFPEQSRNYAKPAYKLFRSVTPAWDNTPRRKNRGTVFANSTPALYGEWLGNAIADTLKRFNRRDERLIFVNAWNEWAEGAHLEPDKRFGFAYLQATRNALERAAARRSRRIVLVSHDAHPHGAQLLALNMAKGYGDLGFDVDMIVLDSGPLMDAFHEVATVYRIDLASESRMIVPALLRKLREAGGEVAIVNTTVSGPVVPLLKEAGFRTVSLIHELPGILSSYKLQKHASDIATKSDTVVFADQLVREGFEAFVGRSLDQAIVRPQGTYQQSPYRFAEDMRPVRGKVREALGLSANARIVMCAGYGDHRKGLDLFVESLMRVMEQDSYVVGLWVGHCDDRFLAEQTERIRAAGLEERFIFTGFVSEPQDYFAASDVYALTSREDPFPSVVMEAFDARVPVVAFEGAGGFETLLRRGCGLLSPAFDTDRFAEALAELLANPGKAQHLADVGHDIVLREYAFRHYLFDLLDFAGRPLPKVSVVVPNYNYERYIESRMDSVVSQRFPIYELLVLDDCSTDDSASVIRGYLSTCPVPAVFVANEKNSGSVFAQWARGVEMAKGDLVWIAEADDLADPEFLEELIASFDNPDVVMAYAQSRMIDSDGNVTSSDYLGYVSDIDEERWKKPYLVSGREEIAEAMFLKNTIPNVSAVVFRRDALKETLADNFAEITSYRNAGDWVAYLRLLEKGSIAFTPRVQSSHRRHQGSVTIGSFNIRQLREIIAIQRDTIERFGLDDGKRAAAEEYAQKLYEQFDLATPEHLRFDSHPELVSPDKTVPAENA